MTALELPRERYIVDADGKRVAVILDIEDYERMVEAMEDLEDIAAVERSRTDPGQDRDAEEFFDELFRERGWHTGS